MKNTTTNTKTIQTITQNVIIKNETIRVFNKKKLI